MKMTTAERIQNWSEMARNTLCLNSTAITMREKNWNLNQSQSMRCPKCGRQDWTGRKCVECEEHEKLRERLKNEDLYINKQ